uniref:Ig-like domain-containing protein n=1 Tax=Glossina austeni TaxID=7395 RepID=A0A1A9URS5_GLOAU
MLQCCCHRYYMCTHIYVINYDSSRGGVSVITEKGDVTTSFLLIQNADLADSGKYSCAPSNADVASVRVHVLNGNATLYLILQHIKHNTIGYNESLNRATSVFIRHDMIYVTSVDIVRNAWQVVQLSLLTFIDSIQFSKHTASNPCDLLPLSCWAKSSNAWVISQCILTADFASDSCVHMISILEYTAVNNTTFQLIDDAKQSQKYYQFFTVANVNENLPGIDCPPITLERIINSTFAMAVSQHLTYAPTPICCRSNRLDKCIIAHNVDKNQVERNALLPIRREGRRK